MNKLRQDKHISQSISGTPTGVAPTSPYVIDYLVRLGDRLNTSKSKLDIYYNGSKRDNKLKYIWQRFQGIIDLYKPLRSRIEQSANAQIVTNAWLKYWEMYKHYNLITNDTAIAFFNAELPGAALCAYNHYIKTAGIAADWRASSKWSDDGSLGDTYGLYANNRARWIMSADNDGDATRVSNLLDFEARLGPNSPIGGVNLYSHDAGINVEGVSGDLGFNKQEILNARVHLGCALAGFMTMRIGANFIAKQYTCFETITWNLIIIYAGMFDKFYICKPITSRPYNSEIYLIGIGFRGLDGDVRKILLQRLEDFNDEPLLPPTTDVMQRANEIVQFANIVFTQQIRFIDENVSLFEKYKHNLRRLDDSLRGIKKSLNDKWIARYPVPPISRADHLPAA